MSKTIRFSAREGELREDVGEFIKEVRKVRSPFKSISYINPFIARAQVGYNISERLKNFIDMQKLDKKISKLASTKWGRTYISKNVLELVKKHGIEKVDIISIDTGEKIGEGVSGAKIAVIRRELKELNKLNIDGKEYMRKLKEILDMHLGEETSKKIMNRLMMLIHNAEIGKNGIINPGRAVYEENGKVNIVDYDIKDTAKIRELAKEKIGIRRSKIDYFKHKDALLMAEALEKSSNTQEAIEYYTKRFNEELERDQLFRQGFQEWMQKEMIKIYNIGVALTVGEEIMRTLPAYLAAMINRMLAQAVRRLPLLGDIAAVQYEAGAALAEIGSKLSDRIESMSYMSFNLDENLSGSSTVNGAVSKSVED